MKKKNQTLILIAGVLLLINCAFFFVGQTDLSSSSNFSIAVADTSQIQLVKMRYADENNTLNRNGNGWQLNGKYAADQSYTKILLAVLNRVVVRRQLGPDQISELVSRLDQEGVFVEIEGIERNFFVLGNRTYTKTYFIESDHSAGYEVEIPGYRDYVGGIFQLTSDQWRDRLIFKGNFHTIQKIEIMDKQELVLNLKLEGRYFGIAGLDQFDTTALVNYLNSFSYVQANERIAQGRFPRFDSLQMTLPESTIKIDDLGLNEELFLEIFPQLRGENYQLIRINNSELTVFATNRVKSLLRNQSDFRK